MKSIDVIIIGAGIIGCSISLSLARRGLKCLNVDSLPAAGYGSTSHSSAIIRPFYSHNTACAIAHEARCRWQNWREFLGDPDSPVARYIETGGLVLVREGTEQQYELNLAVLDSVGVDYQLLSPSEIQSMYPGISMNAYGPPRRSSDPAFGAPVSGAISAGILIPASGYVSDPQLAAGNLYTAAIGAGSVFSFNCRVTGILRSGNRITGVQLDSGANIEAPVLVNAAGPHSSLINDLAGVSGGLRLSTQPHRHEVAYLRAPPGYRVNPGFVVDLDAGVYQRPDGVDMLIGSADPECDPPDIADPDHYNRDLTNQWTTQVHRAAQRWPELGIENTARGIVGLYDVSNDWIPIYDRTDLQGYYLAIGTSGNQFKNAPVVGDLMAAILENPDHDTSPSTLQLDNIGQTVDLSFYSRNRVIQQTTSVMA